MQPISAKLSTGLASIVLAWLQNLCYGEINSAAKSPDLTVTPVYREALLKLMLAEANVISDKLYLPENKPITREKLTEEFVSPPSLNRVFGGPSGTIRTDKYVYAFAFKGKLTSLGRLDLLNPALLSDRELTEEYKNRAILSSQVDTNAAWQAMLPYLRAGILDVERLNRECEFQLKHLEWGKLHVPKYTALWTRGHTEVARITILMPDKALLALRIEDVSFNIRPSFQLPGTNVVASSVTNSPSSPKKVGPSSQKRR